MQITDEVTSDEKAKILIFSRNQTKAIQEAFHEY
jgi:hypothetical protein